MHLTVLVAMTFGVALVLGQGVAPLASKRFKYPDGIPYRVDTDRNQPRGDQLGYNICNSTTEGPASLCQTAVFNSLDDFCIWAPPTSNHSIGEIEGEMVAWCTKPGHGTRVIPSETISGVQFTRTPDYIQVVGFLDQTKINMLSVDSGGEMDPHGADGRGNPIGGVMFTNAFSGQYAQVVEWHSFMGSNKFCLKACDQTRPNAEKYCEHIFDRIGCEYNAPSNARDGIFESCAGNSQDFPGVYTDSEGKIQTFTQPPESAGPIASVPYTARVPVSSSCSQFRSAEIYGGGATVGVPKLALTPRPTSVASSSHVISAFVTSIRSSSTPPHPTVAIAVASPRTPSNSHSSRTSFIESTGGSGINPLIVSPSPHPLTSPTHTTSTIIPSPTSNSAASISNTPIVASSSAEVTAPTPLNLSPNTAVSAPPVSSHSSNVTAPRPSQGAALGLEPAVVAGVLSSFVILFPLVL